MLNHTALSYYVIYSIYICNYRQIQALCLDLGRCHVNSKRILISFTCYCNYEDRSQLVLLLPFKMIAYRRGGSFPFPSVALGTSLHKEMCLYLSQPMCVNKIAWTEIYQSFPGSNIHEFEIGFI